jgi:hypothetical protein
MRSVPIWQVKITSQPVPPAPSPVTCIDAAAGWLHRQDLV